MLDLFGVEKKEREDKLAKELEEKKKKEEEEEKLKAE